MFENFSSLFSGDGKYLVIAFVLIILFVWLIDEWVHAEFHPLSDKEILDPFDEIDEHYFTIPRD